LRFVAGCGITVTGGITAQATIITLFSEIDNTVTTDSLAIERSGNLWFKTHIANTIHTFITTITIFARGNINYTITTR